MNHTSRRGFLKGLGAAAVTSGLTGCAGGMPRRSGLNVKRPNVLFILTDDQRGDTIHALGNPHIQTPNLDRLVQDGVVFDNAYCMGGFSAAVCLPSRMMILRGRSWFTCQDLPQGFPCFPTAMRNGGYQTFHLGKQGNTDLEVQRLFDESHYVQPSKAPEGTEKNADQLVRLEGKPGQQMADGALAFLRRRDRSKPFFMFLAGPEPHDPRVAPKEYLDRYDAGKLPLPKNYLPYHPFDNGELLVRDERLAPWPRTREEIQRHLRDYYATVTYMDEQFGRIFAALKECGEYDNTVIVFTSDQGIAIGSHGLMGKQNLYEPSMRSPVIFSGPGIPKGRRVEAFAYLFDIFPTVCELAGVSVPPGLEGQSQADVIRGRRRGVRDTVLLAYKDVQRAVRHGRWKLIRYPHIDKTQLFDLASDPDETRDLAADPRFAERIEMLTGLMKREQSRFGDQAPLCVPKPKPGTVDLRFYQQAPPA